MTPFSSRPDLTNLILAVVMSVIILVGWQVFFEAPNQKILKEKMKQEELLKAEREAAQNAFKDAQGNPDRKRQRKVLIDATPRVNINSSKLHGSISLRGLRFDDLTLVNYRDKLEKNSDEVVLFSPSGYFDVYFTEFGWVSSTPSLALPNTDTIWTADKKELTSDSPVTLSWKNDQGVLFEVKIALDKDYMFTIDQRVTNASGADINIQPYAFINRYYPKNHPHNYILHEGPMGVFDNQLVESPYQKLAEKTEEVLSNPSWLGISDKYWLTALVPAQKNIASKFSYYYSKGQDRFQVETLNSASVLAAGKDLQTTTRLFAGAKELPLLEKYRTEFNITLFDRAVDFGVLYFMTKPIFMTLNYFYSHIGNFGLALMLLTVLIKLMMYPLANKSYVAMSQMKRFQPEMTRIREQYTDDKMRMNQEIMAMYKREKVNPAAGCLPMLIQIPVFFALYKVLFVTIEMRHAPFYGWIKDLSAPDPTNIFTLFGLINWMPPTFMHIGVLPILFSISMAIQYSLNPTPTDPMQAKVFKWMPWLFLFLFAGFPAGLVLYWVWSNSLSIIQQKIIMARYNAKHKSKNT